MSIIIYIIVCLVIFTFFIPIIPLFIINRIHSSRGVSSYETIPSYKSDLSIKREVEKYIKTHEFKNYLENDYVIVKIDDLDNFTDEHLYIKFYDKIAKQCFDITGEEQPITPIWAIFQTYFTELITYSGLQQWIKNSDYNIKIQYH